MILHGDDQDPAMRYEGLYRFAFDNCRKQEDPWEEATQNNYEIFMSDDLIHGKISLYRILHKLIFDNFKSNIEIKNILINIEKNISKIKNQEDAINVIDKILSTIKNS